MIPYIVILFATTGVAYLGRVSGTPGIQRASIVAVALILICFAGLRDYHIGTDTGNYVYTFYNIDSLGDAKFSDMEPGYIALTWVAKLLSANYAALLFAIIMIVVILYLTTIIRLVERYEFGIYLFIVFGSYTWAFNGARQAIAGAICFWGLRFVLERRLLPYLCCIAVAMLFHKTAAIALVVYFVATERLTVKRLIGLAVSVIVLVVFLRIFSTIAIGFLGDKYASYSIRGEGGGYVATLVLTVEAALLYLFRRKVVENNAIYTRLLNIYLITLVPAFLTVLSGVNPSGIMRLSGYFGGVDIILWPLLFQEIRKTKQRDFIGFAFVLASIGYFYMTTSAFGNLAPYRINSSLFG